MRLLFPFREAEPPPELRRAVGEALDAVRTRNAVAVAGFRVVLRSATLALWIASAEAGGGRYYGVPAAINAVHLLLAAGALLLLLRRRWVHGTILAAAWADVLVVMIGGWRAVTTPAPVYPHAATVGYLMGVMELMLLFASVTLRRRDVLPLAVGAVAFQLWMSLAGEVVLPMAVATVLTLAVFAAAVVWAGLRLVEFAARLAVERLTTDLLRDHRDALQRAHDETARQRDQVLAAQQEAEALAQLIVHDLKNPLTAVMQLVGLAEAGLREAPGLDTVREDLRLARAEGDRLGGMIGDLLVVARLESHAVRARPRTLGVRHLLEDVARSYAGYAREREVAVEPIADFGLTASLDPELVRRLLDNMVGNALRHVRPRDRIQLVAERDPEGLRLVLRNSGPPVPEEVLPFLFQKHATGGPRAWHNAGLGLYLCRLVAEAHGGSVAHRQTPEWPVVFEVRFPGAAA